MKHMRTVLVLSLAVSAIGAAIVTRQPAGAEDILVWSTRAWTMNIPTEATEEQRAAATLALINGETLPQDFTIGDFRGSTTGMLSVTQSVTGEGLLTITSTDQSAHLGESRIYVNDSLVVTATRAGGHIVDDTEAGMATMTVQIEVGPSYPFEIKIEWLDGNDAIYRTDSFRTE